MFQYHGWVMVVESLEDDCTPSKDTESLIRSRVEELDIAPELADLRWVNANLMLHIAGAPNHRRTRGDEAIDLFRFVGSVAPGSYGLMHINDDEDQSGMNNYFQVLVMVRGNVHEETDTFLSPVIPTLEDGG